jgi:hypothetical protein
MDFSCIDVDRFFLTISKDEVKRHTDYWAKKIPTDTEKVFHRWLFAFLSVHTTWEMNVRGFLAVRDIDKWLGRDSGILKRILIGSGVGLHNNRTRFISEFANKFWNNTPFYSKAKAESWAEYRNRVEKVTIGLQKAKTSFAIEMCDPINSKVFCEDVHMLRLFGVGLQRTSLKCYEEIEKYWIKKSDQVNVPPYVARVIFWNRKQEKENCHYWAHCLS